MSAADPSSSRPCRDAIAAARRALAALSVMAALMLPVTTLAAPAQPLTLDGQLSPDGSELGLSWTALPDMGPQIYRRERGARGAASWAERSPRVLLPHRMVDGGLRPGHAYEYQVRLTGSGPDRYGYWVTGSHIAAQIDSGRALVVVDDSIRDSIAPALDRLKADLIGAGWLVTEIASPRGVADAAENLRLARALRSQIADAHAQDPFAAHALLLIGHVPVVRSGWANPDGHKPQPHPTDLFYADPTGHWPETDLPDGQPKLMPSTLPADGIAMPVGRIDFANLPPEFGTETDLLNAYLDRDHRWRHGQMPVPARAYGSDKNLLVERNALGNIVGARGVAPLGHHDHADKGPFLFGVDFGSWKTADYLEKPPVEAVFTINFGSGKQIFDKPGNAMLALLARSTTALTVAWGGRPAWQLHGMALGDSIGQAQMRTVNNGALRSGGMGSRDYQVTGNYDWISPIWVNLLGDPTLLPFPLAPPTGVEARHADGAVTLRWTLPEDASDVTILRADGDGGPFAVIATDVTGDSFTESDPVAGGRYMIRARGMARVHAGSFWRLSQGVVVAP